MNRSALHLQIKDKLLISNSYQLSFYSTINFLLNLNNFNKKY